ncbi:AraC family transcriptional regulator [Vibrio kasasachensis]|uniref:AraC family transcriptional regulator n=1 Tax=Vibrio kasasachensis TaxID=2910248 RepID=UPI003D135A0F
MKPISVKTLIRPGYSWRHYSDDSPISSNCAHYHSEYELILLFNFKGVAKVGNIDVVIPSCSLLLIPPNVPHDLSRLEIENDEIYPERHSLWIEKKWISNMVIHCNEMRKLSNFFSKSTKVIQFSQKTSLEVKGVVDKIDCSTSSLEQLSVLMKIFSLITQDKEHVLLSSSNNDVFELNRDRVEVLSTFINDNYAKEITLASLAKHIYCSERTTARIFKSHFGETFSQRLKKIRLSHAANMIETTSLSISHISSNVGYSNLSNFNRLFKEYKSMSPTEYRTKFSN